MQISLNFKTSCCKLKIRGLGAKLYVGSLKSKSPRNLLNKNINFNKAKRNRKWKIPHTFQRDDPCASAYIRITNSKWWVGPRERKKEGIFCAVYFVRRNICVLSQCIVYWIHFQNIHIFILLYTLLLLVFKILQSLQCVLQLI